MKRVVLLIAVFLVVLIIGAEVHADTINQSPPPIDSKQNFSQPDEDERKVKRELGKLKPSLRKMIGLIMDVASSELNLEPKIISKVFNTSFVNDCKYIAEDMVPIYLCYYSINSTGADMKIQHYRTQGKTPYDWLEGEISFEIDSKKKCLNRNFFKKILNKDARNTTERKIVDSWRIMSDYEFVIIQNSSLTSLLRVHELNHCVTSLMISKVSTSF